MLRFLRFIRVRRQLLSASYQQAWTEAPPAVDCWMAVRSSTTCGYASHAISVDVRYWTIVYDPSAMFSEPESVRARELIIDQHAFASGTESSGPCRLWLIDRFSSLFNVKPSTVPTRLIHELYTHTRTTHPERFLRAEKSRRPNTQHHLGTLNLRL